MNTFITNKGNKSLQDRISELIKESEELKFLVGFFYFSGLKELYKALKQNNSVKMKVLVGLNIDIFNNEIIEYAELEDYQGKLSNEEIRKKFFTSLKKSINTEKFDTQEFYEQAKFFINLIENDRLTIKKTVKPNHAKLYLFKLNEKQVSTQKLFITGSSNLTSAGLTSQHEFNVQIMDYGINEAENYFDDLWNNAIEITTKDNNCKKEIINVIKNETLIKEITPFEAYVLVLKMYLESFEKSGTEQSIIDILKESNYHPYTYQIDAIQQALGIIEKHNGVILADVVGLGKTVIACAIAKELKKRGIIICPPGLMGNPKTKDNGWNMYKEQFGLSHWEVWSLGDLKKLQNAMIDGKYKNVEVIIIDEAHRFRNQDTQSYEYLKNICRNKIVILLTATPFNNNPSDIFSLLKLFITPKKSSITLESNLADKFKLIQSRFDKLAFISKNHNSKDTVKKNKAKSYYKDLFDKYFSNPSALQNVKQQTKYLAQQIRDIIEPVIIRRNRLDLQKNPQYKNEITQLSKVEDPKEWFFELTKDQSQFYDKVIKEYFADPEDGGKFKGAIYRPSVYLKQQNKNKENKEIEFEKTRQNNLFHFMRRLLVKRFESSFGAFEQSINNFKEITEHVRKFINNSNTYILDRDIIEKIYTKDPNEIEQYLNNYISQMNNNTTSNKNIVYKLSELNANFIKDIESDIKLFENILNELNQLKMVQKDPKRECLIKNVKAELSKDSSRETRKIIIFSEYADTVKYLQPHLERAFNKRVLTVSGNLTQSTLNAIYENFDASYPKQKNDFDILLTTDKLSEGFNLNRAGTIINYDIPWNPVRVIQRVGRINRINKKVFDKLYIFNFFPTEIGRHITDPKKIAEQKMFLIHKTLGEDAKIFDADEEPSPAKLYQKIQQNPDKLEEESFYTKILQIFKEIEQFYPDIIKKLKQLPPRIKVAKKYSSNELLVFIKKDRLYIHSATRDTTNNKINTQPYTLQEVLDKIRCTNTEKSLSLSQSFWDLYTEIKNKYKNKYNKDTQTSQNDTNIEQQAINNLKTLLQKQNNEISEYKDFLEILCEDIEKYGTLPNYTLRRIANIESRNENKIGETIKEINALKKELGEDYLEKEKEKIKNFTEEIIVAIENQKVENQK